MKKILFLLVLVVPAWATAQTAADCLGAVSICDTVFTLGYLPTREVNEIPNEINPNNNCLATGEVRGRWYKFATVDTGVLNFTIFPIDTTYDFDWALFQMHYVNCDQIWGDTSLLKRCDFSGINGTDGSTGANGLPGLGNQPTLHVDYATIYFLYISSAAMDTTDTAGYTVDFSASTVTLEDCGSIGVHEEEVQYLTAAFPNPVSDILYFSLAVNAPVPVSYKVYDVNGKAVLISSPGWNYTCGIDVKGLSAGVYYYAVGSAQGHLSRGKLVVSK